MPILTGNPLLVDGNQEGASIASGTQDNFAFSLISNNTTRMTLAAAGGLSIATPVTINTGVDGDVLLTIKGPVDTGPEDVLTKWTTSTDTAVAYVTASGLGVFNSLFAVNDISVGTRLNLPFGIPINTDFNTDIFLNATGAVPSKDVFLNFNHTTDRFYSFPDADGTLVLDTSAQTLTNKKLSDSTTTIVDVSDPTKIIKFDAGGTTGTKTTITGAQTADRVLTLPDATDTLAGIAATQTLTNKTISADSNTISNIADASVKSGAAIARAKLASGTANHVIINDGSGVLSSEASLAATRGGTGQTTVTLGDLLYGSAANVWSKLAGNTTSTKKFLNQTGTGAVSAAPSLDALVAADIPSLAASIITSGTFAEARGGTNQSTYTTGDILYASAANTLSKLAGNTTSARQILTQTGTGSASAAPAWAAEGWRLLFAGSLGSAGTSLSSGTITVAPYIKVLIYIEGYAGGGDTASLQFNNSGGTAYRYRWMAAAAGATTFTAGNVAASTDRIKVANANTTNSRNSEANITNDSSVTEKLVVFKTVTGTGSAATQAPIELGNGAWISGASTQISRIDLITTGGNNMLAGTAMIILGRDFA